MISERSENQRLWNSGRRQRTLYLHFGCSYKTSDFMVDNFTDLVEELAHCGTSDCAHSIKN
jgi:hypothetical protein